MSHHIRFSIVALILAAASVGIGSTCHADFMWNFQLEACVLNATDIVVVEQQEEGVVVLETWLGELPKGKILGITDLPTTPFVYTPQTANLTQEERDAKSVLITGQRIVLFLDHAVLAGPGSSRPEWRGANRHQMKISAIWVESKSLHAFTQQFTSWSDLLANPLNYDEKQLRKLVDNMLALRWKMTVTANIQDPAKRATALKKIADSDCSTLQATAIKALGVCGEPALPILRDLISQRGFRGELALDAIVPAAEGKACEELVTLLESEQKFWKENASKLKEADWLVKCEPDEYRFLLYYRYKMTQSILQKLKVHPSQPARDAALSLRKFWQTLPMPSANQKCQMVEVCNQVISPEKSKSTSSSANLHWPTQASSAPSNYPRSLYIGARKNVR